MKIFALLGILFLTSCAKYWDWKVNTYMGGKVSNQSSRDAQVTFCSEAPAVTSKTAYVLANTKNFWSKTLVKIETQKIDRPQNYEIANYITNSYPSLSSTDLFYVKFCKNNENLSTGDYLIIENANACPAGFDTFDQQANPC